MDGSSGGRNERRASSRRRFLSGTGAAALALLAGCSSLAGDPGESNATDADAQADAGADVGHTFRLTASEGAVGVGDDAAADRYLYNGQYPGPELRVSEGDTVRVVVENDLPESTTVHWHGQFQSGTNDMDGVPGLTQSPIAPGETYVYEFEATPAGTHWYHSHVGLQLDRGLYGPLVVEPAETHVAFDREYTVLLDDYLAGEPEMVYADTAMGQLPVAPGYDAMLVNGRSPASPPEFTVEAGERVRFRLINAAATTNFSVYLAGHRLTVTHTDGLPVEPTEVDVVPMGMGERYDVVVEADNPGAWQLEAVPFGGVQSGVDVTAQAVVRYEGADPDADLGTQPVEERVLELRDLESPGLADQPADPGRELALQLRPGDDAWAIDARSAPSGDPLVVEEDERTRFAVVNRSPMSHPVHLHGHHFRVGDVLKDTVVVPGHGSGRALSFDADNPGDWLFHCHHLYHHVSGMSRVVEYTEPQADI